MNRTVDWVQKGKWRETAPTLLVSAHPIADMSLLIVFNCENSLSVTSCCRFSASALHHLLPRTLSPLSFH